MQFSTLSFLKTTSLTKYIVVSLKVALLLGMLFFVGTKLWQHQESSQRMLEQLKEGWQSPVNRWAIFALVLVPLNWILEAVKWQVLAIRVTSTSFMRSLEAVLAGLCLGMVTPRSLGDYAGRLLVHRGQDKVRLVGAVLLNRIVQSLSTYACGIAGILILVERLGLWNSDELLWLLIPAFMGTVAIVLLMGPGGRKILWWLKQKYGEKVVKWISVMSEYTIKEMLLINGWSFIRYAVFTLQYLFLLWWANIQLPALLLVAAIAATFLLKSLLPAFNFLSELGVREFSALIVFSALELPHAEVIAASLLLWFMNICLPALLGLVVVLKLKRGGAIQE